MPGHSTDDGMSRDDLLALLSDLLVAHEFRYAGPPPDIAVDRVDSRTLGVQVGRRRFLVGVEAVDEEPNPIVALLGRRRWGGGTVGPGPGDDGLILERPVLDGDGILRGYEPVAAPHPLACAGLHGGCPDCRELYLLGLRTAAGGREPAVGVCLACSHKHWPWEAHADHQWDDACPYEGTGCVVGR